MKKLLLLLLHFIILQRTIAQESPAFTDKLINLPARFNDHLQKKTAKLEAQLTRQTEKYLQRLARKEEKLRKKLQKTDSTAAKQLFEGSAQQYAKLAEQLKNPTVATGRTGQYLPYVDSLKTSLSFLQQNNGLLNSEEAKKITGSLQQVQQLQGKLQQTEQIKAFINNAGNRSKLRSAAISICPIVLPKPTRILIKSCSIIPNRYRNTATC